MSCVAGGVTRMDEGISFLSWEEVSGYTFCGPV